MNTPRDTRDSLEARLRADARALRVAAPEGLEQRVSAAVWREADAARRAPAPRRRRFFHPALAGLLTSACALALVVVWHDQSTQRRERTDDIRYLVETVQTLPTRLASAELPIATRLAAADPLAREIASVRSDARSALDFLAANFLPSEVIARNEQPDEPAQTQGS